MIISLTLHTNLALKQLRGERGFKFLHVYPAGLCDLRVGRRVKEGGGGGLAEGEEAARGGWRRAAHHAPLPQWGFEGGEDGQTVLTLTVLPLEREIKLRTYTYIHTNHTI